MAEIIFQDVIYRKDVFDAIELSDFTQDKEYEDGARLIFEESLKGRIDEIPIAVPSAQWTPVSKGLPDLEYDYEFEGHDLYSSDPVLVTLEDGRRTIAHYEAEDIFVSDSSEGIWYSEEEDGLQLPVSAWLPLPDPYEEE